MSEHYPSLQLPNKIAAGVRRSSEVLAESVALVGGGDVTNEEWGEELRTWEVPFATMLATDPDFVAMLDLWKTVRQVHSFVFVDELAGNEHVPVKIVGKLEHEHVAGPFWTIETIVLKEQRIYP